MSGVATAIIGGAVVGAVATNAAAGEARRGAEQGAATAAQAQIESTQMQIEEMARQFDFQMRVLMPQIQQQYNAQRAYSDLLGFGGPQLGQNMQTGFVPTARPMEQQEAARQSEIDVYQQQIDQLNQELEGMTLQGADVGDAVGMSRRRQEIEAQIAQYQGEIEGVRSRPYDQERIDASNAARGAQMGGPGTSGMGPGGGFRDPVTGAFRDPNLDPTRLAETETLSGTVRSNLLAGTTAERDPYRRYIEGNRMAAASPEESTMARRVAESSLMEARGGDLLAEGAAGTGVYGDVFTESPGYAFQVEEMERQLERVGSAGGPNIGGRAVMEAQRRAQGLAAQDYYNWAAGRERDLQRLGAAEAADIGRLDAFAGTDIERGDRAYALYEQQRLGDIGRQDQAYQDYLRRREGDVARLDAAAAGRDRLAAADLSRSDQAYYNYLNQLAMMAGFGGGPASQAVSASQAQGANVAGAYRGQGAALSGIYGDLGTSMGNIGAGEMAGYGNAITGAFQNWLTYQQSQPTTPAPPTT